MTQRKAVVLRADEIGKSEVEWVQRLNPKATFSELALWLFLLVRGGRRGRTVALLLIPVLFCADQLASSVLKPLRAPPRPSRP